AGADSRIRPRSRSWAWSRSSAGDDPSSDSGAGIGGNLGRLEPRLCPPLVPVKRRSPLESQGFTVAVICWLLLGVEKPAGVPRLRIAVPAASGSNWTLLDRSPPLKTAGLLTIVPTLVSELVTVACTFDRPPRSSCPCTTLRNESRRAGLTV